MTRLRNFCTDDLVVSWERAGPGSESARDGARRERPTAGPRGPGRRARPTASCGCLLDALRVRHRDPLVALLREQVVAREVGRHREGAAVALRELPTGGTGLEPGRVDGRTHDVRDLVLELRRYRLELLGRQVLPDLLQDLDEHVRREVA